MHSSSHDDAALKEQYRDLFNSLLTHDCGYSNLVSQTKLSMNTNQPSDESLLRANLLGFVTQVKAAADAFGKPVTDAEVGEMHKRASDHIQSTMTKRAKITEVIRAHIAQVAAPAPAAA